MTLTADTLPTPTPEQIVARIRALADKDAASRAACAADPDCACTYKDCFEHGKWHACTHSPWTAIREALGPVSDAPASSTPADTPQDTLQTVLRWAGDRLAELPERRDPVSHGKAEILRELLDLLGPSATTGAAR